MLKTAMLAAVPAFAQTNTPPAGTGNSMPDQQSMPNNKSSMAPANKSSMAPANKDGLGASAKDDMHSTHRSAMARPTHMMHSGKADTSQNAAVDSLNEKSFQAAQNGQAAGGGTDGKASTGMMEPGGTGSMNDMSGGSMTGSGSSSGNTTKP